MDGDKDITHLNLEDRRIIETGIRNGSTKTAIATTIGKDNSTVGKEIKLHYCYGRTYRIICFHLLTFC